MSGYLYLYNQQIKEKNQDETEILLITDIQLDTGFKKKLHCQLPNS